jgi:hypothetical protein
MRGAMGEASMGITICASCPAFPAAAMGDAVRARKESSNWAVTRPAALHVAPASLLLGTMPGAVLVMLGQLTGDRLR